MPAIHIKNHDGWNILKKKLDGQVSPRTVYFYKREVWYCSIGHNIGFEEDGKGGDYSRPVVIIKRCGANLFIGIPLTSQVKTEKYYLGVGNVDGRSATAMIAQIRLFSSKRLINKIDTIPMPVFTALKKATRNFIF
jgi:mRNA interferase MazF